MNTDKWISVFLSTVVIGLVIIICFKTYLEHEKFKLCLASPKCEYTRPASK